jgi:hypothetical protein
MDDLTAEKSGKATELQDRNAPSTKGFEISFAVSQRIQYDGRRILGRW